ncbi:MAG: Omp28-related outer membrane protein [Candidatus Zixiibacteriota bacterium]|nr:MAG: Omp28-related outer membrane protein [candidate division Zixibacteria bacterium]
MDGTIDCGNAPELWRPHVENRIPVAAPLVMSFTGYYIPDSLSGQFTVTIFAEDDPGASNLWLRIALTESGIYYQAPNGATIHNYIFRDMIPSTEGHYIEINQGETRHYTFPFNVPQPLEAGNCALVAFVQSDQDWQILQGARIKIPDLNNTTEIEQFTEIPQRFNLGQNYPNPFNSSTRIDFAVVSGYVDIAIFDITGSLVKTLYKGELDGGSHSVEWDGKDNYDSGVSSGIYYYRVRNGDDFRVNKMTYLK